MKQVDHRAWARCEAIVEEKVDGANVGVWFDGGEIRLQSRGHVLRGGAHERQFAALHGWALQRERALRDALGDNLVLYGEWCFAKHRAFYDALPDWLLGFDILDRGSGEFLSTARRNRVLATCDVTAVACLWHGPFGKASAFGSLIGPSRYKTPKWREALSREAANAGVRDPMRDTDDSEDMEGVYVRIDDGQRVIGRMKLHREPFEKVRSDEWRSRPLIRNARRSRENGDP